MLSSTGGVDAKNSSSGAVVVGEGKCAAGAEVYVGFAVSEVVPANCARVGENVAAAKVGSTDKLIATNKRNVSSPASNLPLPPRMMINSRPLVMGLYLGGVGWAVGLVRTTLMVKGWQMCVLSV